jgi:hypothetical protein
VGHQPWQREERSCGIGWPPRAQGLEATDVDLTASISPIRRPGGVSEMRTSIVCFAIGLIPMLTSASAQVPLATYVDANGFIDVQKLTCAQLANTFQEDADMPHGTAVGTMVLQRSTSSISGRAKKLNTRSSSTARLIKTN